MNNNVLVRNNTMRDLGVIFDTQLTFRNHILNISNRAFQLYGFIVRNCKYFVNINCIKTLYFTYVRSILEYGSVVWSPMYSNHKYTIEKVQNKFLRYLYYKDTGIYDMYISKDQLKLKYSINTLENRRMFSSVMFLYKLLHNEIDDMSLIFKLNFNVPIRRTRNPATFYTQSARTNHFKNSPINVMCQLANEIRLDCDIFHASKRELVRVLTDCFSLC